MPALVILSNTCSVWTIYMHKDSIKFVLEAPGAKTLAGMLLFCGCPTILWQFADPFGGTSIMLKSFHLKHKALMTWYCIVNTMDADDLVTHGARLSAAMVLTELDLGPDSIWRLCLTSIGNPIVEIRRSYDRLISTMGFPILVRYLYIE